MSEDAFVRDWKTEPEFERKDDSEE
jgi:hypothetical protein